MLSFFSRHHQEPGLRQKCCEWFMAYRHALLTYARQQVDSDADVGLLIAGVARKVTQAVCSGRVPESDIAPYTLRSLYNGAADLRRKNESRLEAEKRYAEEAVAHGGLCHGDGLSELEDEHILARRAVRRLPEELATVITLRVWCELTFAEISAKLRVPETTVRRRYEKGLQQIKEILNQS